MACKAGMTAGAGATSCYSDLLPEECLMVRVVGCEGFQSQAKVSGSFELYEGDCAGKMAGSYAYRNPTTVMYLYHKVLNAASGEEGE